MALGTFAQAQSQLPAQPKACPNNASYKVHLSFDDGPAIPQTMQVLDILKRHNVKATFLISMDKFPNLAAGKPPSAREKRLIDVIERMKYEGHTVGSHSYEHLDHGARNSVGEKKIRGNLEKSYRVSRALGLETPSPFRFPYGSGWLPAKSQSQKAWNASLIESIRSNGHVPFHWDLDTEDWHKTRRNALPRSLLNQICSSHGGVALLHDIHPWTVSNLENMIIAVKRSGHNFVPYQNIIGEDRRSTRNSPDARNNNSPSVRPPSRPPHQQNDMGSGGLY